MKRMIAAFAMALPLAAFAHAHLEGAQPAKDSVLQKSPDNVILQFNEQVALTSLKLQKKGDKAARDLGPLPADESVSLSVPLPTLPDGEYVLSYVAQSSDTHVSQGTIAFKVSASAKPSAGMMDHMHHGSSDHADQGAAKRATSAAPAAGAAEHDHNHPDSGK